MAYPKSEQIPTLLPHMTEGDEDQHPQTEVAAIRDIGRGGPSGGPCDHDPGCDDPGQDHAIDQSRPQVDQANHSADEDSQVDITQAKGYGNPGEEQPGQDEEE